MKIVIIDSWNGKFSNAIAEHWKSLGHEVITNSTKEVYAEADMVFFYQSDNQLVTASTEKWPHKGNIYAGCVDIEAWANQPQSVDWSYVTGLTFMAEHIREMVLPGLVNSPAKIKLIKPGIDLDHFDLRPPVDLESTPIRKVAYVVGDKRIWDVKRFDVALMLIKDLIETTGRIWQLHILGSYSTHAQYNDYCQHLIENLNLSGFISWYERQPDVSKWLDDKDFFLLPSTKEAFSYATAEAMAKGIKPIIGNWRSADVNWKPFYCQTYGQMYQKFLEPKYEPLVYRDFVEKHYNIRRYMEELDKFVGIGGETK